MLSVAIQASGESATVRACEVGHARSEAREQTAGQAGHDVSGWMHEILVPRSGRMGLAEPRTGIRTIFPS